METIKAKTYLETLPKEDLVLKHEYIMHDTKSTAKAVKTPYYIETVYEYDFEEVWEGLTEKEQKDHCESSWIIETQRSMRDSVESNLGLVKASKTKTMALASALKSTRDALEVAGLGEEAIQEAEAKLKAQYGVTE